jgi:uncharacterized protein YbjT (DUF2867 family)
MKVLVTGAAGGGQGATGRLVAEQLLARGVAVRAFVRTEDQRAERLRALGAEVVAGDLREISQVEPALNGVDKVFFTYPVDDGLLDATAVMASAAKKHGVRQLVEVSQLAPDPNAHTPRLRQHWVSEQVFDMAGIGAVHLRATVFYENMAGMATAGLGSGRLAVPLGPEDNTIPLISGADVARIATTLLHRDSPPADPHYLLVGAVPTLADVAQTFANALGSPLQYVNVAPQEWRDWAVSTGYYNPHAVAHLTKLWEIFGQLSPQVGLTYEVTDSVARVTGSAPETLAEYAQSSAKTLLTRAP